MFRKLDVRRKSIVTLPLSSDNHKIIVRHFVNLASDQCWDQDSGFETETKRLVSRPKLRPRLNSGDQDQDRNFGIGTGLVSSCYYHWLHLVMSKTLSFAVIDFLLLEAYRIVVEDGDSAPDICEYITQVA